MDDVIHVHRVAATAAVPTGLARCGASEVDITPHVGLPMAGYATAGKVARGMRGRLYARALYVEDAHGQRSALCFVDLFAASRYVLERAASCTARVCGIAVDRLMLAATHTHTGPGQFFGNALYDTFAQVQPGFDVALADWLAARIAQTVHGAAQRAVPARVGLSTRPLWGVSRNRSLTAFQHNHDANQWHEPGWPGQNAPQGLTEEQRAVDPRLTVLAAVCTDHHALIGAFALFGCHATCLGANAEVYSPDWPGIAVREAQRLLAVAGAPRPVVAVAASAAGDVNALREDMDQGLALARSVGMRIGGAIAETAREAQALAADFRVEMRYAEWRTHNHRLDDRADTELAVHWAFGAPTLGGAEDGRTLVHHAGLVHEGMTSRHFLPSDPQYPKAPALGVLQEVLVRHLIGLEPSVTLPLHALSLGEHLVVTVPGEPTVMAAWRIESALKAATGVAGVTVLGYAGDYGGYYATEEEYRVQHYEGASMLYGRNAARHLGAKLEKLVTGPPSAPMTNELVSFHTGVPVRNFTARNVETAQMSTPRVTRKRRRVEVCWRMPSEVHVVFAEGYFVRLEAYVGGRWHPVQHQGHHVDDVSEDMKIIRHEDVVDWLGGQAAWMIRLWLPWEPQANQLLRVQVPPRASFPGLTARIP